MVSDFNFTLSDLSIESTYSHTLLIAIISIVIAIVILGSVRLYFLRHSYRIPKTIHSGKEPKISIHLPICNEPPELVLNTIRSVVNLSYRNYELLVISNNTTEDQLWKPIENKINALDDRFKFLHIEKIAGYKAGALNYALKHTDPLSKYIFTLDSDYILNEDALDIAIGTIEKTRVDVLQFPQSYRNVSSETSGIEINYKHYFDCYLSYSQSRIMALPTGTLSVIRRAIFDSEYLWPVDSITEDASLGVELVEKKMKIGFCNTIIGRGIMPTESLDYTKQFQRWVFGNFQVLHKVWRSKSISFRNKIHLSTLLTAWLNLLGFVFVVLVLALPLLLADVQLGKTIFYIGLLGILLHCMFQLIIYRKISNNNLMQSWNGFLIHLGLLEIGAFYWITYFIRNEKPFIRTNKFLVAGSTTNRLYIFPIILFIIGMLLYWFQNYLIATLVLLFGMQLTYAKFHKDQELVWSKFNLYKNK